MVTPLPCLSLIKKIDRTDHFQNWSGWPLFFQFHDLRFLWSYRREGVVAPTVLDQRSGWPISSIGRGDHWSTRIYDRPLPPTMHATKKPGAPILFRNGRADPHFLHEQNVSREPACAPKMVEKRICRSYTGWL